MCSCSTSKNYIIVGCGGVGAELTTQIHVWQVRRVPILVIDIDGALRPLPILSAKQPPKIKIGRGYHKRDTDGDLVKIYDIQAKLIRTVSVKVPTMGFTK